MRTPVSTRFGVLDALLICTAVIWGVNVVVVKLALDSMTPLMFNSLRFALATTLSWGVLQWAQPSHRLKSKDLINIVLLGLIGHAGYQVLFIYGINLTTAGNTSLLLATIPIWVALLSAVFALEEVSVFTWAGIGCSFLGIAMVVLGGGKAIGFALHTLRGDAMILSATLLMAIYTIRSRPLLKDYSPLQLSTYTMTSGTLALLLIATPTLVNADYGRVNAFGWGGMVFSSVFAVVVGYYIWNRGLQGIGPARTAVYGNLSPVVAMLTGWAVLRENIVFAQIMGAVLIITGLFLARRKSLNKKAIIQTGTNSE